VYDLYRDYIQENRIFGPQIEDTLEHAGFIKVHGESVYYFAKGIIVDIMIKPTVERHV
jgi:hypothetical protein